MRIRCVDKMPATAMPAESLPQDLTIKQIVELEQAGVMKPLEFLIAPQDGEGKDGEQGWD